MDAARLHSMIARGNMGALQHSLSKPLPPSTSRKQQQGSWKGETPPPPSILTELHEGRTALHAAVEARRPEAVALLLSAGAPPDARSSPPASQTPLHAALRPPFTLSCVPALLSAGASLTAKDAEGLTPLDLVSHEISDLAKHTTAGQVYAWGASHSYQLGAISGSSRPTQVAVQPPSGPSRSM
eukprot:CAMPEP_0169427886 /NCGR_PEP_ID=MMETSP1042-20121227/1027_1 /TAXON_ID=464988 /ORGANISM="Hemiselmis andersenii, Strain CCMP1180" /LENGTH=183 /DNA_ID=CAMNT_0009538009 /DNA_START=588 /DNA_END=1136 /DNA_ORIENTATION=+